MSVRRIGQADYVPTHSHQAVFYKTMANAVDIPHLTQEYQPVSLFNGTSRQSVYDPGMADHSSWMPKRLGLYMYALSGMLISDVPIQITVGLEDELEEATEWDGSGGPVSLAGLLSLFDDRGRVRVWMRAEEPTDARLVRPRLHLAWIGGFR